MLGCLVRDGEGGVGWEGLLGNIWDVWLMGGHCSRISRSCIRHIGIVGWGLRGRGMEIGWRSATRGPVTWMLGANGGRGLVGQEKKRWGRMILGGKRKRRSMDNNENKRWRSGEVRRIEKDWQR